VIDTYGCGEINGIATQILGDDKYYIIEPRVIVELGNKIGDYYEIVLTDLDNLVMPFIKYKPGDLIDGLYFEGNEKFPMKYFKKIVGRTADIIELNNGRIILPVNLIGGTFIRQFKSIVRHKVICNGTKMHFLFESAEFIPDDAVKLKLDEILSEYEVPYSFEIVKEILPGKNGKHTYFEKING
jgi:phenylacetate-CoA ligase